MIVLLDLNWTLVENSAERRTPFLDQIAGERYRGWLIDLVRPQVTILVTARPERYRQATLASLLAKTGWQPEDAAFNLHALPPPLAKERALAEAVWPRHGRDAGYLAIESNPRTRAMYARHGIRAVTWQALEGLTALPAA